MKLDTSHHATSSTSSDDDYRVSDFTGDDGLLNALGKKRSSLEIKAPKDGKKKIAPPQTTRRRSRQRQGTGGESDRPSIAERWRKLGHEADEYEMYKQYLESADYSAGPSGRHKLSSADYWKYLSELELNAGPGTSTGGKKNRGRSRDRTAKKRTGRRYDPYMNDLMEGGVPFVQWIIVFSALGLAWHILFRSRQPSTGGSSGLSTKQKRKEAAAPGGKRKGKRKAGGKIQAKTRGAGKINGRGHTSRAVPDPVHGDKEDVDMNEIQVSPKPSVDSEDEESEITAPFVAGKKEGETNRKQRSNKKKANKKKNHVSEERYQRDSALGKSTDSAVELPKETSSAIESKSAEVEPDGIDRDASIQLKDSAMPANGDMVEGLSSASTPDIVSTAGPLSDRGTDHLPGDGEGEWTTVGATSNANASKRVGSAPAASTSKCLDENASKHVGSAPAASTSKPLDEPSAVPSTSSSPPRTNGKVGRQGKGAPNGKQPSPNGKQQSPGGKEGAPKSKQQSPNGKQEKEGGDSDMPPSPRSTMPSEEHDAALARMLQKEEEMAAIAEQQQALHVDEWEKVTTKKRKNKKPSQSTGVSESRDSVTVK